MIFYGLVTATEAKSYEKKDKTTVQQQTITCIDWCESNRRLKDTVDITITQADFSLIRGNPMGQQLAFYVTEIRPNPYSPRMRFTGQLVMEQFQVESPKPAAAESTPKSASK